MSVCVFVCVCIWVCVYVYVCDMLPKAGRIDGRLKENDDDLH